jgi:hypothetical protein
MVNPQMCVQRFQDLWRLGSAALGALGVYLASRNKDTWAFIEKETRNFLDHIRLTDPSQNPDPGGPERWKKELETKLRNMRQRAKRLVPRLQQRAKEIIDSLERQLPK